MFLKLTELFSLENIDDRGDVCINFDYVVEFHPVFDSVETPTNISCCTGEERYVKETVSQIMDMLGDSQAVQKHKQLLDEAFDKLRKEHELRESYLMTYHKYRGREAKVMDELDEAAERLSRSSS